LRRVFKASKAPAVVSDSIFGDWFLLLIVGLVASKDLPLLHCYRIFL